MSMLYLLVIAWLIQVAVSTLVVLPVVLAGRRHVHWHATELLALVVPFAVWAVLMHSPLSTGVKTLSNLAFEPGLLAVVIAVVAVMRIKLTARLGGRAASILALVLLSASAAGIFWLTPGLSE